MKKLAIYSHNLITLTGLKGILEMSIADSTIQGFLNFSELAIATRDSTVDTIVFHTDANEDASLLLGKLTRETCVVLFYHDLEMALRVKALYRNHTLALISQSVTIDQLILYINSFDSTKAVYCHLTQEKLWNFAINSSIDNRHPTSNRRKSNAEKRPKALDHLCCKKLSPREDQIMTYLLRGMKTTDIGLALSLKPTTISTLKGKIFKKMGVSNIVELTNKHFLEVIAKKM